MKIYEIVYIVILLCILVYILVNKTYLEERIVIYEYNPYTNNYTFYEHRVVPKSFNLELLEYEFKQLEENDGN